MDSQVLKFLVEIGKLKSLDRTGWTLSERSIGKPETVAGHMYRMAIMSMLLGEQFAESGANKLVRMCLIHDMAECIVGDITPFDGISPEQKHNLEANAMTYLVSLLPDKSSQEFQSLFDEYESQQTIESRTVKELDRFDAMLQAFEYEKSEYESKKRIVRFSEFFDSAVGKIYNQTVVKWVDTLVAERNQFWDKIT